MGDVGPLAARGSMKTEVSTSSTRMTGSPQGSHGKGCLYNLYQAPPSLGSAGCIGFRVNSSSRLGAPKPPTPKLGLGEVLGQGLKAQSFRTLHCARRLYSLRLLSGLCPLAGKIETRHAPTAAHISPLAGYSKP